MTVTDTVAEHREAVRGLVAATRELMLAAGTTDVDAATVEAARTALEELTGVLGDRTRDRVVRAPFDGPADARASAGSRPWRLFDFNPMGIPLEITFTGDTARARLVAHALHEGPHDSLHGGFAAHLMDCMLGTLMQARGVRAVTASLDLRYLHRTPLDAPLELFSRIVSTSGRKVVAEGWIEHAGTRTVEAHGLFVDIGRPEAG